MARKLLDLAKDKIETLFGKIEDNFAELYQDKTQKDQEIQSLATGVNNAKSIHGLTDPLVTTAANYVGQQYTNTLTGDQFTCVSISGDDQKIYTWLPSNSAVLQTIRDALNGKVDWSKFSNPNLLDNWYFVNPINQKGLTEYTGTGYIIDRWYCNCDTDHPAELTTEGLILSGKKSILQRFEINSIDPTSNHTLSVVLDSTLIYCTGKFPAATNSDGSSAANQFIISGVTFRFRRATSYYEVQVFYSADENEHLYTAAKLELGSIQTLAHKEGDTWILNDPPPNKAIESLKCKMYQQVITAKAGTATMATARLISDHNITVSLPIAPLRANPKAINNPTGLVAGQDSLLIASTLPIDKVSALGYNPGDSMITLLFHCPDGNVGEIYRVGILSGNQLIFDSNL